MINKWNFQTPTEEELHKRDALAAEIGFSPVICLLPWAIKKRFWFTATTM